MRYSCKRRCIVRHETSGVIFVLGSYRGGRRSTRAVHFKSLSVFIEVLRGWLCGIDFSSGRSPARLTVSKTIDLGTRVAAAILLHVSPEACRLTIISLSERHFVLGLCSMLSLSCGHKSVNGRDEVCFDFGRAYRYQCHVIVYFEYKES